MNVSIQQVKNGVLTYIESDILPHLSGIRKVAAGAYVALAAEKAEEMILKYSKTPAIAVLDLIGQDGSVDIDRVYKAVAPMVKDGEKIGIDVPMIGRFNLDKTDLEKIYKNIRG